MSDKKDYSISPILSRQLDSLAAEYVQLPQKFMQGLPPTAAYGAAPPGVSYTQMTATAPPSYAESLSHPVVASPPGAPPTGAPPQYPPQFTSAGAAAAASAQQLQMEKLYLQSMAAAQQAQKVAYAQQQAFQQHPGVYMQQQAAYAQQVPGYYPHPSHAAALQPGQNVLVVNGFDAGARFDGMSQPAIPPPPPGIAPNAAQLAAAAGAQVSVTQKKGSFLSGGSGGGFTFW